MEPESDTARQPLVTAGFDVVADAFFRTIPEGGTVPESGGSGAALSVWIDGAPVVDLWGGIADARTGEPFQPDTLSVIFSCTKGLASVVVAMLMERGELPPLDTPVAELWPEFGAHGKERVTIGDALAHRAGLSAPRRDLTPEEALDDLAVADVIAAQEPLWVPGEHHQYHAGTHGSITSKLVMLATDKSMSRCFAEYVAGPLQADAWIGLPTSEEHRVSYQVEDPALFDEQQGDSADTYWVERATSYLGSKDGFNTPRLHRAELAAVSGIATASGLARIWSATVTQTNGVRLINDDTVRSLRQPRSVGAPRFAGPPPYQSWGAGVMVPSDWERYLTLDSFGHDGAGGQVAFADPGAKIGFAYLTNQMGDWTRGQSVVAALSRALG